MLAVLLICGLAGERARAAAQPLRWARTSILHRSQKLAGPDASSLLLSKVLRQPGGGASNWCRDNKRDSAFLAAHGHFDDCCGGRDEACTRHFQIVRVSPAGRPGLKLPIYTAHTQ